MTLKLVTAVKSGDFIIKNERTLVSGTKLKLGTGSLFIRDDSVTLVSDNGWNLTLTKEQINNHKENLFYGLPTELSKNQIFFLLKDMHNPRGINSEIKTEIVWTPSKGKEM